MSRTDTWMPLYIGDYLADTRRLTTVEHGAYLLLLMEQWRRGWLPDDDEQLARITGLRIDQWRRAAGTLRPYFDAGDIPGTMRQKRLHAEREKAMDISAKRADAARSKNERARREPDESGGRRGAKSVITEEMEYAPNPLKNGKVEAANAEQMQQFCTPQSQLQKEEERKNPRPATRSTPKGAGIGAAAPIVVLPEWLPAAAWSGWCEFRAGRPKRAPWNQNTAELCLKVLAKLRAEGNDPSEVIDQSRLSGWPGLFPVKRQAKPAVWRNGFAQILNERRNARGYIDAEAVVPNPFLIDPGSTRRDN